MGKEAASFRCSGKKCYASISLKTQINGEKTTIVEPFEITNLNWKHVDGCLPKNDDHFVVKALMNQVKNKVVTNPLVSTQQLYETERDNQVAIRAEKKETSVTMPDYSSIRSCLIRTRGKTKSDNATNILEVDVKDTLTSDKQRFLIFDNKNRNRICFEIYFNNYFKKNLKYASMK
jgi:hypothetical protein